MKKAIWGILFLASLTTWAAEYEVVDPHYSQMKTIEYGDKVLVEYPSAGYLGREAVGDVIYYGSRKSGNRICRELGHGDFVKGSKIIIQTRAISTNNVVMDKIRYAVHPIRRLAYGYKYPKTKIVKEIECNKADLI